ncbi:hypothetical protein AVEN_159206-1 [Araneus ventricosus]|uniref:Uncharacterized protein n=1 Tax=Araneus ventricosus TaxID=182803 RepID=A0A4Y2P468_ARAVE|nr:hypothetical protein AVEN_159206-1 [Araneus ventricosus]
MRRKDRGTYSVKSFSNLHFHANVSKIMKMSLFLLFLRMCAILKSNFRLVPNFNSLLEDFVGDTCPIATSECPSLSRSLRISDRSETLGILYKQNPSLLHRTVRFRRLSK